MNTKVKDFVNETADANVQVINPNAYLIAEFSRITINMLNLYKKKTESYGNSFDESFAKLGFPYALGRMLDKVNRLIVCTSNENVDTINESIEDTLMDLASYSVMTLSYLNRKHNHGIK